MVSTQRLRGLASAAFATLALLLLAAPARAQDVPVPHLLLAGGIAFPNGTNVYRLDNGLQLQGALELTFPRHPLALRVEALYNRFGFQYVNPLADCAGTCPREHARERTLAGTVDAVVAPRTGTLPVVPYLVVGAGVYRHENDAVGDVSSGTDFGLNGGAGLRIPALHLFAEARQHQVKNAPNYLPLTVGIRF